MKSRKKKKGFLKKLFLFAIFGGIFGGILAAAIFLWAVFLQIPDFGGFEELKTAESTKIYDRTGKILLYDVHRNIKRTTIPFDQIPRNLKNATVAMEDSNFYRHKGIDVFSIGRAFFINFIHNTLKKPLFEFLFFAD